MLKFHGLPLCLAVFCGLAEGQTLNCDLQGYKANDGLKAEMRGGALEFAWRTFGQYTQFQLRDITHHYPEWKRHAPKLRHDGNKRVEMDYADFFNDPAPGYNPCHVLLAKDRKIALDLFLDQQAFNQRWS